MTTDDNLADQARAAEWWTGLELDGAVNLLRGSGFEAKAAAVESLRVKLAEAAHTIAEYQTALAEWQKLADNTEFRSDIDRYHTFERMEAVGIAWRSRAVAAEARLAAIDTITDEVHGHGADTLEGEMWRLRTLLNRISAALAVVPQPAIKDRGCMCEPLSSCDCERARSGSGHHGCPLCAGCGVPQPEPATRAQPPSIYCTVAGPHDSHVVEAPGSGFRIFCIGGVPQEQAPTSTYCAVDGLHRSHLVDTPEPGIRMFCNGLPQE